MTLGSDEKLCPFCAETIKSAAVRCRYCQSDLVAGEADPQGAPNGATYVPAPESPETVVGDGIEEPHEPGVQPLVKAAPSSFSSSRLTAALTVVTLLLAGLGGWAWWRASHPEEGNVGGVITSTAARDAGMEAAAKLTQTVLSYNWTTLDEDIKKAEAVCAPSFRAEYAKTMAGVKAQAVQNQVKMQASTVATSIISASPSKVEALVFVNRVTTAKGSKNQQFNPDRVLVTLTRGDGDWRVSKLKPI